MSERRLFEEAQAARILLAELRAQNDLSDEDEATVIEGETDLYEAARSCVVMLDETQAHMAAIGETIVKLEARKARLEQRGTRIRDALLGVLDMLGMGTLPLPEATLSKRAGTARLVVTDEDSIPADWWETVTSRKLKRTELARALKNKIEIPGATLSNGAPTLAIKRG